MDTTQPLHSTFDLREMKSPLLRQKQELEQRLDRFAAQWREKVEPLQQALERVDSAIAALDGKIASGNGKQQGRKRRLAKPSCTDGEVASIIENLLANNEQLSDEELFTQVRERVRSQGKSLTGLHLSLRRALEDPRFRNSTGNEYSTQPLEARADSQ